MNKQKIDPWKSFEVKDYDRLVDQFGIERIKSVLKRLPIKHHYFSREIVFGHKSLQTVLDAQKKKQPFAMLTGLMPSGRMHFGHKMVADLMIYFQGIGAKCYVTVADVESYLVRGTSQEEAKKVAIEEYLINYIALGLKPKKTMFYFQSNGPKSYMNLSKYAAKRTTFNEMKDIYGDINPEKITSVLTQVADILFPQLPENGGPKPVVVPVGADQLPHLSMTRDIAKRMKSEYGFVLPSATFHKMMPGLKGSKLASSDPMSAIFLTDTPEQVRDKVMKYAFSGGKESIKEHRDKGGDPDVDISYQWLTFLEEDDKKLKGIYNDYKSGKLLTGELKQILIDKINNFLNIHQRKRKQAKGKIDKFILKN